MRKDNTLKFELVPKERLVVLTQDNSERKRIIMGCSSRRTMVMYRKEAKLTQMWDKFFQHFSALCY